MFVNTFSVFSQAVHKITVIFYVHWDDRAGFLSGVSMGARLANFLVTDHAAQHLAAKLLVSDAFESLVQGVDQRHEELNRILLFSQVDWLAQHPEVSPESSRNVIL